MLVLDEPNSNLDEQGDRALMDTIAELNKRGKTTVLITHRMSALSVVAKILVLHEGKLKAYGPRDEVLAALQAKPTPSTTTPSASGPAVTRQLSANHG